jgi:cytidine deaminase
MIPLVALARQAALAAYAPYSRFSVGCAIESVDGEVALGSNMENACYRLGVCAEIRRADRGQAGCSGSTGSPESPSPAAMSAPTERWPGKPWSPRAAAAGSRFSRRRRSPGRDLEVISANGDGTETATHRISMLLPLGFGPDNLKDAG